MIEALNGEYGTIDKDGYGYLTFDPWRGVWWVGLFPRDVNGQGLGSFK